MAKIYALIFFAHFFCSAFSQQLKLLKSTVSPGGISTTSGGRYSLSQTIGQASLVNSFRSSSTRLLQGFQHPFLHDKRSENSTISFSVYPNPSNGKVSIEGHDEAVGEQLDVSLFDLQGKLIDKVHHFRNGNKIEADFTKAAKGIYELVVVGEKSGLSKTMLFIN